MNNSKAKKIRKSFLNQGIPISSEPYGYIGKTIISSEGRRRYQLSKKILTRGK